MGIHLEVRLFSKAMILAVMSVPSLATAQTPQTTVTAPVGRGVVLRQIFQDRGRAIAEGGDAATPEYVATFSDRSQCALKVVERKDSLVSLDISNCAKRTELQVQTLLEPSLLFGEASKPLPSPAAAVDPLLMSPSAPVPMAASPSVPVAPVEESRPYEIASSSEAERPRISIGAGVSMSPRLVFESVREPGYSGTSKVELELANGFSLSADIRVSRKNSWGFIGAIGHEVSRDIKTVKISSGNVTVSGTTSSTAASFTTWLFEGNAVYRWDGWYLPFGVNYSYFQFTSAPQYSGGWELSGGLGLQVGVGYYLNRNLALELWSRSTRMNFKLQNHGVTTLDFGSGTYSSGFLTIRGVF